MTRVASTNWPPSATSWWPSTVPIRINGALSEARLERVVEKMFREQGWNVLEQPEVGDGTPDFIASGRGKKLVIEVKRASEDRKDRIIPLLSRPRWRRPTIPAAFPVIPSPSQSSERIASRNRSPRRRNNLSGSEPPRCSVLGLCTE